MKEEIEQAVMTSPVISVIVPVYNTEKYLRRCIDSVLSQTYKDFELLLIDDGSTDSSGAICDEYAAKDARVRVFHKENGGVSSARNLGLDNAKGEWVTFVDSDDWISNDAFFCAVEYLDCDVILGSFTNYQYLNSDSCNICGSRFIDKHELAELFHKYGYSCYFSTPWSKLYRFEIIKKYKLRFDEKLVLGEDTIFVLNFMKYVEKARFCPRFCYFYYYIEDEFNQKYKKKFRDNIEPIFCLYQEALLSYGNLEKEWGRIRQKYLFLTVLSYYEGYLYFHYSDVTNSRKFCQILRDADVIRMLKDKNKIYYKGLLFLGRFNMYHLVNMYIRFCRDFVHVKKLFRLS